MAILLWSKLLRKEVGKSKSGERHDMLLSRCLRMKHKNAEYTYGMYSGKQTKCWILLQNVWHISIGRSGSGDAIGEIISREPHIICVSFLKRDTVHSIDLQKGVVSWKQDWMGWSAHIWRLHKWEVISFSHIGC